MAQPIIREYLPEDLEGLTLMITRHIDGWIADRSDYFATRLQEASDSPDDRLSDFKKSTSEDFFRDKDLIYSSNLAAHMQFIAQRPRYGQRYIAEQDGLVVGYAEVAPLSAFDGHELLAGIDPADPLIIILSDSVGEPAKAIEETLYSHSFGLAGAMGSRFIHALNLWTGEGNYIWGGGYREAPGYIGALGGIFTLCTRPEFIRDASTDRMDIEHKDFVDWLDEDNIMCSKLNHYELEDICLSFVNIYKRAGGFVGIDFETFAFNYPEEAGIRPSNYIYRPSDLESYVGQMAEEMGTDVFELRDIGGRKVYFPTDALVKAFDKSEREWHFSLLRHLFGGLLLNPHQLIPVLQLYSRFDGDIDKLLDSLQSIGMPKPVFTASQYPANSEEIMGWYEDNGWAVAAYLDELMGDPKGPRLLQ